MYKPPNSFPPDSINNSSKSDLREFFILLMSVGAFFLISLIVLLTFADFIVPRVVSKQREVEWFQSLYWDQSQTEKPEQVLSLLAKLEESVEDEWPPLEVRVHDMAAPNAFLYPGGTIGVTKGLLEKVETEEELSFVLAHEMAHFAHRDAVRAMSRSVLIEAVLGALGFSGAQLGLFDMSTRLWRLHYSRSQEHEADAWALELLYKTYGQVGGAFDFFERLREREGGDESLRQMLSYISTHPLSQDRIEHLQTLAEKRAWPIE